MSEGTSKSLTACQHGYKDTRKLGAGGDGGRRREKRPQKNLRIPIYLAKSL